MATNGKKKTTSTTEERPVKKAKKTEEEIPQLVVTSKVKEMVKATGLRCSGDFPTALNKRVWREVKLAVKRCQGNNRQTVREVDAF
jgi:hypothetical protein